MVGCAQSETLTLPTATDGATGTGLGTGGDSSAMEGGSGGGNSRDPGTGGTVEGTGGSGTGGASGATGTGGTSGATGAGGIAGATGTGAAGGQGARAETGGTAGNPAGGASGRGGNAGKSGSAGSGGGRGGAGGGQAATFTQVYAMVLDAPSSSPSNCAGSGCHIPGPQAGIKYDTKANAYQTLISVGAVVPGNAIGSGLYTSLMGGEMPKNRPTLSAALVALVASWINAGAQNN
jgi:hypothetical protein